MPLTLKYKGKNITDVPETPGTNYVPLNLLRFSNGNMGKVDKAVAPDSVVAGTKYAVIGTATYMYETVPAAAPAEP